MDEKKVLFSICGSVCVFVLETGKESAGIFFLRALSRKKCLI